MARRFSRELGLQRGISLCLLVAAPLFFVGCGLELPTAAKVDLDPFDLSEVPEASLPLRPAGQMITDYAVEYVVDLGIPDGQPGHASEVRVVLPSRMPAKQVPTLIVNGAGAYLFSGMVLSDEDIEPMLPYVEQGFAIVAYETDGCQPDFERDPTAADIAQMTRQYVASKAGLVNAKRALSFALEQFPEIDADQLYTIGHSSGGKQALLLAAHDARIRGCVAFAPACQMDFGSAMTVGRIGGPDGSELTREVKRSMPLVHAKRTQVPMLLVYSSSDSITRPSEVLTYAKAVGELAEAISVECRGHGYVPDAGFQPSIEWLRKQIAANAVQIEPTALVSQTAEQATEPMFDSEQMPIEGPLAGMETATPELPPATTQAPTQQRTTTQPPRQRRPATPAQFTPPNRQTGSSKDEGGAPSIQRNPFFHD